MLYSPFNKEVLTFLPCIALTKLLRENYKNLGWNVYSWTDDDDELVYAQLYDAYGNDVLLFRVDKKGQLEAYGGIDGSSDSWDVVSKKYTTD